MSNPMSFWTEQDVLRYIKENNIPICSVYGEIVSDSGDELVGQMDIADYGLAKDVRQLKTTGCDRTGCMFCGFGCHLNNDDRFARMKETHPQIYDYIMRSKEEGGLNYKEIIDWINEHGNMNIRY
jgi:3'-phosphoadenosine 5'-phosphosulfate sulfotransferase (PAPS reductase)/FAD synthetase